TLSGGQKNRLMLAKVLANPKSCLILDEPTNDLDMDTLDMLEEVLINYKGTLIVVSHDRDFLDQTVTKILAFEGDGDVEGYIGGYSDYLNIKKSDKLKKDSDRKNSVSQKNQNGSLEEKTPTKLSYKLDRELKKLPEKIEKITADIDQMNEILSDPYLYQRDPDLFHETVERLQRVQKRLEDAEERWLELEEMRLNTEEAHKAAK
ncbi:MAG: ATP-binding cassette domain-containing protein, partial [Pseudomonadota bacterium]